MVNSKAALEKKGVVLWGPMKPTWFLGDCSVPKFFKKLLRSDKGKPACALHDWCFLLIAILYEVESIPWHMAVHQADAQLRWNLVLLRKRREVGRVWGWMYYRALRLPFVGSRRHVSRRPKFHPRRPTNPDQLKECIVLAREFNYGELTEHARKIFRFWANTMNIDIRKELRDPK